MKSFAFAAAISCLLCAVVSEKSFSQALSDTSSQQNALNKAISLFNFSAGQQSPIYNGPQYYLYSSTIKGNAYLQDVNDFTAGSVFYDGALYTGVPMLFDLVTDKVVVLLFDHFSTFSLINEKVQSFDLLGHHVINIHVDSLSNPVIRSGYYDELYKGKIAILAKRSKSVQETAGGVESHFSYKRELYVKKDNVYYSSNSLKRLLEVLKDKKKELQQYIKSSQISFRQNPEEAMVKIASYYDHPAN